MFKEKNLLGIRLIQIGLGLLFLWGGLEKFFEGFLGGVGLDKMAQFLGSIGLDFLGASALFGLAVVLALTETIAGVLLLINQKVKEASIIAASVMVGALVLAHIPSGNWMMIMLHISVLTSLIGLALIELSQDKN